MVIELSSEKIEEASSNETLCFTKLLCAFFASHSKRSAIKL
jgi:hypothetical protein